MRCKRKNYFASSALLCGLISPYSGAEDTPPVEANGAIKVLEIPAENTSSAAPKVVTIAPVELKTIPFEGSGTNDSNPSWSNTGDMLAIERNEQNKKEIVILKSQDFSLIKKIYYQIDDGNQGLSMLIPGLEESVSYNAGLTWSRDGKHFVFMSNAGEGNYDLYLGDIIDSAVTRLTDTKEKDGMPDWSPTRDDIVFVSGRTGGAQIYRMNIPSQNFKQLTHSHQTYLYPIWSPNGEKIVYMRGENENHDIFTMELNTEIENETQLTSWNYDDLRPTWSPDGKYIAFYTNYNIEGDSKSWSLAVIKASEADKNSEERLKNAIVATHVIPDIERGPAWLGDSQHIVYIKDIKEDYNPIYISDVTKKNAIKITTGTKMNHDVSISRKNTIAFRAQENQWDRVFVMKIALDKLGEL